MEAGNRHTPDLLVYDPPGTGKGHLVHYSITFVDEIYSRLVDHLLDGSKIEKAAYLLCGVSESAQEIRLLAREFLPVGQEEVIESSPVHMKIVSRSFLRAMKRADSSKQCFVFAHSHPPEIPRHSLQDDKEEASLFSTAYNRIHSSRPHASLVFTGPQEVVGRVWLDDGSTPAIDVIRIVGNRLRFIFRSDALQLDLTLYDRQVRAFGKDLQGILRRLRIGIVGVGGTGSSVAEQLIRLGAENILISDGERLDPSNVTRGYGSRLADAGSLKTALIERLGLEVGLGAKVRAIGRPITFQPVLREFRDCDVIFSCTDDQWGRSLLTRLSINYCIPVIDVGVRINSKDGVVNSIQGRVTTLFPGGACLFCRGRITSAGVRAEMLAAVSPEEVERLRKEGYAPELGEPAPAVIAFTTAVAAGAVSELLHMLTGFMGTERASTEVIYRFDDCRVGPNSTKSKPDCFCSQRDNWAKGDQPNFLGLTWRKE